MANLMRVRALFAGPPVVGPSVATAYFDATVTGGPAAWWTFWKDLEGILPGGMSVTVDSTGDILDDASGDLVGSWSEASGAVIAATGSASWVQGVGMRVIWSTGGIHFGRRTRGSTFVVPIHSGNYQFGDGTLNAATITGVLSVAQALVDSDTGFRIWSRPHKDASDGGSTVVTGTAIHDQISWLRTRRT